MKPSASALKPQDVLVLLKLISWADHSWRQLDIAQELDLSQAEVANSLERLRRSHLIDESKKKFYRLASIEFLIHGLKYIFPPEYGALSRGVPTGRSAKPMAGRIVVEEVEALVWPYEEGSARGMALYPLYPSVPKAALKDSSLYELLVLTDTIRAGRTRERKIAEEEIRKRLLRGKEHEAKS